MQGYTNPSHQVSVALYVCMVALIICLSTVWNLLHVTFLGPRSLTWLLDFWKIRAPLIVRLWKENLICYRSTA